MATEEQSQLTISGSIDPPRRGNQQSAMKTWSLVAAEGRAVYEVVAFPFAV